MHRTHHLSRRAGLAFYGLITGALATRSAQASSTLELIGSTSGGNQITARVLIAARGGADEL
jgi:hypothetical protein